MAKALIIGDPHFKINDFDIVIKCLGWVEKLVVETTPDIVICLGDVFNDHGTVRSEILSTYIQFVKKITNKVPYVHIIGNHEFYRAGDCKYHALQSHIGLIDNFYIIDKPTTLSLAGFTAEYIPHIPNIDNFPTIKEDICFTHQSFLGADFGNIKDKFAIDPQNIKSKITISGHIHKRQTLGNVIFPGSLYAKDNRDIDEIKGAMIFDTASYGFSFIESPLPLWKSLEINVKELKECSIYEYIINKINDKDIWSITLIGYKNEILEILNSKDFKKIKENGRIKIKTNMLDSIKKNKQISTNSLDQSIVEYVNNVYEGNIDKSLILKEIDKIKKEANL